MIDVENIVYDAVATALRTSFPGISVGGEYVEVPSSFPCVSFCEDDNSVYVKTQDSSCGENHATVVYNANIYTNKAGEKKSTARAIAAVIDDVMQSMNFVRTVMAPVPNIDRSIFRITMRFTGVVSKGAVINGNTVYQVYRR